MRHQFALFFAVFFGLIVTGCSSSGGAGTSPTTDSAKPQVIPSTPGGSGASPSLSADATTAATGDVPDNVNFLTYRSAMPPFSIKYPEGWAQSKSAHGVTFQDKNNLVRVSIAAGSPPTVASVRADLAVMAKSTPGLKATVAKVVKLHGIDVVKAGYSAVSAPNPVTDKRVTLLVDRYVIAHKGMVATIDLGTPRGVDNVDAFRLMSGSFTWR